MSTPPTVAILNPRAANGKTAERWPEIERRLRDVLGTVAARFTKRPGHATQLVREAIAGGADLIIAVGGDGTVNEVANGFLDSAGAPINPLARLGVIPIGTGSDLQRTLGIPAAIDQAVKVLGSGTVSRLDLGRAAFQSHEGEIVTRHFVNLLSFGMGGSVAVRAKDFFVQGKLAFLYATMVVALGYRGKTVRLTIDDEAHTSPYRITNIAIGNGQYHGGGMHPCPLASMDDGLLEVTTIDYLNVFELVRDIRILYSDDVYQHPKVRHHRAKRLEAISDEDVYIEVDGEPLGRLPLQVEVVPGVLPVVLPK